MSSATAVIPHWNRRDLLNTLLSSLRAQTRPFDETIVVDNGSVDGSAEFAEQQGARVVRLDRNLGFAAAVNRGIEAARSEWVAILNNDVTLDPAWLATLLDAAEREAVDFATGKILRADNPSIIDGTFDEVSRGACACRCGAGKPDSSMWNQPRRIRIAPLTAALFRRALFREIGMLDERFVSYLEDVDFGLRCAIRGRAGIYVPIAIARHRGSTTLGSWSFDTVQLIARNQVLLAAKHFRSQPRWPIVAGQLLWGVLASRHARGFAWLSGKLSGWRLAGEIRRSEAAGSATARDHVRAILEAGEEEIFRVERESGSSTYWRVYFWLVRR